MMLVEQTTVPIEALPVTEFRDHLRLGTGFADDSVQDIVLESYVRAAMAAIEARTGKVLVTRSYSWSLTAWRQPARQVLPVAPVAALTEIKLLDRDGGATIVDPASYRLAPDSQRPCLTAVGHHLPTIPHQGSVELRFTAGFGATWADLPPDLGQAVFLLAAHYYENRSAMVAGEKPMPFGVSLLIDRYRTVRLFGEAAK
ncbi:Gene Transfer Agent (GTA) [Candidatus Rhodobacter oscarellae]|uniref:Gene Transfer Agent (GTA) n=1 Tax=Candidatus Rhodobacter oscarellae TaxID=1675527 RepID=A0A0J9E404_9RHOB|nr:head-tail connector protein [Candidatus Rhodobacter lobularis]KMW56579.1 Gene Transfer Agent (GTA) [Candidatus Rhodobacter lobularis]